MRLLLKSGLERVAKTASGYQHKHEWGGGGTLSQRCSVILHEM